MEKPSSVKSVSRFIPAAGEQLPPPGQRKSARQSGWFVQKTVLSLSKFMEPEQSLTQTGTHKILILSRL